jgi:hypothetical protein
MKPPKKPLKKSSLGRRHVVTLALSFDKPCTPTEALCAAADNIHGEFYPTPERENGPQSFKVVGVRRVQTRRPRR